MQMKKAHSAAAAGIGNDLLDRVRGLVPALRERATAAENLRRLPDETVADFGRLDLCKIWQPKVYGGLETDLATGLEIMQEAARGCASSAWCLTVYQQHNWILAHFPKAAQDETIGTDPTLFPAAVLAPRGKARKVDGGYVVGGVWPFGSGCDHSAWMMFGALVVDEAGAEIALDRKIYGVPALNARLCLVPRADVRIKGDWNTAGLAGTGSHSIAIDDVFVPEHRTLLIADAIDGAAPGQALHRAPLFRSTYYSFLVTALAGPAPGVAQGALDCFLERIHQRVVAPMNLVQSNMIRTHRQVAEAGAKIAIARDLLRRNAETIDQAAASGATIPVERRAEIRLNAALAVHVSYEAGEIIFQAAGGSALALANPIQRAMRDLHGMKAHYFMDLETALELKGMVQLGRTPFTYIF
ncbi:MAG TPA: acyl-CoA dehydrogenase family protein [Alphaproteobacteria bacterium]